VSEDFPLENYAVGETLGYEIGEVDGGVYAEGCEF
jgi:hypothetical protein